MLILLPLISIIPSAARLESVRIAFDVVIFERLAISSLDKRYPDCFSICFITISVAQVSIMILQDVLLYVSE